MTRVAIAGLGAIGRVLARRLYDGMPGLELACAAAHDRAKAQAWLAAERIARWSSSRRSQTTLTSRSNVRPRP
jgi:hypothetical protein